MESITLIDPVGWVLNPPIDAAGSMMMICKGDKLVRIIYSMCPGGVEAMKQLAKKLSDRI